MFCTINPLSQSLLTLPLSKALYKAKPSSPSLCEVYWKWVFVILDEVSPSWKIIAQVKSDLLDQSLKLWSRISEIRLESLNTRGASFQRARETNIEVSHFTACLLRYCCTIVPPLRGVVHEGDILFPLMPLVGANKTLASTSLKESCRNTPCLCSCIYSTISQ